jgi:peptide/nickel transport system permease protein
VADVAESGRSRAEAGVIRGEAEAALLLPGGAPTTVLEVAAENEAEIKARKKLGVFFWICVVWVGFMLVLAIFASLLPLPNPKSLIAQPFLNPSFSHLLGTDDLGRDLLSRIIYGSQPTLIMSFSSIAVGLVIGGGAGMLAAYRGKLFDSVSNAIAFIIISFPPLLAVLVIVAFWGRNLFKLTLIFSVASIPQLFVVIRATTLTYVNREFVTAARTMGAKTPRIIFRELLPNVLPAGLSYGLIGVATVAIVEGSLAFLGLSIAEPNPSVGNIISEGIPYLQNNSDIWITLFPCLYLFFLLVSISYIGDRLRSRFDVREGNV